MTCKVHYLAIILFPLDKKSCHLFFMYSYLYVIAVTIYYSQPHFIILFLIVLQLLHSGLLIGEL